MPSSWPALPRDTIETTMKGPIRLIAVDLDGTLLNSQKRIAPKDAEALRAAAARGVEIVPVTGRNYHFALSIVQDLLSSGPLISSNGAIIRSKTGETFFRGLLPAGIAGDVLQLTREFRPYTVLTYDRSGEGQYYIEKPWNGDSPGDSAAPPDGVAFSPWVQRYSSAVRFTDSLESALEGDPLEIMFAGPVALMRKVAARLENGPSISFRTSRANAPPGSQSEPRLSRAKPREPQGSGPAQPPFRLLRTEYLSRDFCILDVIHWDCSKGHALKYWSRVRGIPPAEIMAIGDNYNDLEMLQFAGRPVLMGNADESLRQQGWPVTLDCDSGGVACAIEHYVL